MSLSDPISDLLNRIRNAHAAGLREVDIPHSVIKDKIVRILKAEGFIEDCSLAAEGGRKLLRLVLKYYGQRQPAIKGLRRISKPGLRVYARKDKLPRVLGGLGIAILSTSKGILTEREARAQNLGGEVLCYVW